MGRLYFDHNVSRHVGPPLQAVGHDLVFARDLGFGRLTDDAQLLASALAGRVCLTHNRRDFVLLYDAWLTWPAAFGVALPAHPGVLVIDPAPHDVLGRILSEFLIAMPPERLANRIFWWHRHQGWRRPIIPSGWEPYSPAASQQE